MYINLYGEVYKSPIKYFLVSLYDLTGNPELILIINSANIMYTCTNIIVILVFIATAYND